MRTLGPFLPLLLLVACETEPRPYAPVDSVRYTAIGADPFWMVTIGDDRIVLRSGPDREGRVYPRTLPVIEGNLTRWQSGEGTRVIGIQARRLAAPCEQGGRRYEDHVRVTLSGRMFEGCGGRLLR